jgi:hypothetical protein
MEDNGENKEEKEQGQRRRRDRGKKVLVSFFNAV